MQLWPIVLWPKPRARQHAHIQLQFATRSTQHKLLQIFIINVLLQITTTVTTKGVVVAGSTTQYAGNYAGVDAVPALTGLSNGYATRNNYIKNYYQQSAEAAATNLQQQQEQQHGDRLEQPDNHFRGDGDFSHGFMGLPSDNYGNSIVARGQGEQVFNVHDTGLVPTTFTAAGQHYAASLVGLQAITDTNNAHPHMMAMATMTSPQYSNMATNNIDLEHQRHQQQRQQQQQYGHDNVAVADNKANQSLFGRLSNYGDPVDNVHATKYRGQAEDVGVQNYALAYADDAEQSQAAAASPPVREQFHYKLNNNDNEQQQQQHFANYFTKPSAALPPTYEKENQQKYYTLNNYQPPEPHRQQQSQQEDERNNFYNRPLDYEEQTYKQLQALATTQQAPATYYHSLIKQNKNDNKQQQHQQPGNVLNNYQHGNIKQQKQPHQQHNPISTNYHMKQLAKQQQHQQQYQLQQQQLHDRYQHEPEMAETSHSAHFRKQHKLRNESKSKRSDYPEETYEPQDTDEVSHIQLQQLQHLQDQLQQQQQLFVNLQHQLIDHDQQLQIQKHQVQQQHHQPPVLPPITHSVHHNPYSLQALAGTPLTKHTQIIKSIPVHQHHRVLVPFRHNVSIEVPDPIITTIKKPTPIEIPVTKTIAVPDIQEVKIPIEKILPYPVERPVPYIVEKRVPYAVEKQVAKPVYYNVPIKVPIVHTVVHKLHTPQHGHFAQENTVHDSYREPVHHRYRSHHLPHTVHKHVSSHGHRHGGGHSRYGGKYLK